MRTLFFFNNYKVPRIQRYLLSRVDCLASQQVSARAMRIREVLLIARIVQVIVDLFAHSIHAALHANVRRKLLGPSIRRSPVRHE